MSESKIEEMALTKMRRIRSGTQETIPDLLVQINNIVYNGLQAINVGDKQGAVACLSAIGAMTERRNNG